MNWWWFMSLFLVHDSRTVSPQGKCCFFTLLPVLVFSFPQGMFSSEDFRWSTETKSVFAAQCTAVGCAAFSQVFSRRARVHQIRRFIISVPWIKFSNAHEFLFDFPVEKGRSTCTQLFVMWLFVNASRLEYYFIASLCEFHTARWIFRAIRSPSPLRLWWWFIPKPQYMYFFFSFFASSFLTNFYSYK